MSKPAPPKRNGTERAAILLLSLGENEAAEVLKHMGAKDVQRIGAAMTQLSNISREDVTAILSDFSVTVEEQTSLGVGVDDYLRKVLTSALGEDKAGNVIDRILFGRTSKGLESLKWMDPRAVAELIRLEHPQIIAIVLSYLEADQSAQILGQFPDWLRADIVMRIATLDGIQPMALHELDEVILGGQYASLDGFPVGWDPSLWPGQGGYGVNPPASVASVAGTGWQPYHP